MKKIIGIVALSVFVGAGAFAQTPNVTQVESAFQSFSSDVASSLPFASAMGLNWSWAYIGKFPNFGVGLAAGAVTLPTSGFYAVANQLGVAATLPAPLNDPNLGLPLPAYVAEARIGGIFLPFDVGIKAGFIPKQVSLGALLPSGMNLDFHLYGLQVRYQLMKEKFLLPSISVGAAVNHFDGEIGMTTGNTVTITSVQTAPSTYENVYMTAPTVSFNWKSNSLDASVEMSKHILLLFTPYVGAGVSYGFSSAGGGVSSKLLVGSSPSTATAPSQTEIDQINQYLAANGQSTVNFNNLGFTASAAANGWSARAFGGLSVNIFFIKIDGTVMYNFMTGKVGATVGTRLQF